MIPAAYVRIMPQYLPLHRELVLVSGVFQIAGGAGLLFQPTRRAAGIGLVVLLLMVWPANLQMVLNARAAGTGVLWQLLLWIRFLLQPVLILWAWRVSRPPDSGGRKGT